MNISLLDFIQNEQLRNVEVRSLKKDVHKTLLASCAERLDSALADFEHTRNGGLDVIVLLRQYLNYFSSGKNDIQEDFADKVRDEIARCDLKLEDFDEQKVKLTVMPWKPDWLEAQLGHFDQYPERARLRSRSISGDGFLLRATGGLFNKYKSAVQRSALHCAMSLNKGQTMLAVLPTGDGKSLLGIATAVEYATFGEGIPGTTVVIVPTVSLAIDQQRNSSQFFRDLPIEHRPAAYHSGIPEEKRLAISEGVRSGTLPVVYCNPETVVRGRLNLAIKDAAQNGLLRMLVLDEVHILESWGISFRPEFMWLTSLRKELLGLSKNRMRTLLLSATVTRKSEELLRDLFSDKNGSLVEVDGRALRPEPEFWFKVENDLEVRQNHVQELLFHLPRPVIFYTTLVRDAEEWLKFAKDLGFVRCASYTGDTSNEERQKIVRRWNTNELDVVFATTAFGLGIDKQDVRSVVHLCLPEGLNRYYQEVGRGGRDGLRSFSILLPFKSRGVRRDDFDIARSLSRGRSLNEMLLPRLKALWGSRSVNPDLSFNVSIDARRRDSQDSQLQETSNENRRWNRSLLGSLQKLGLILIIPPFVAEDSCFRVDGFENLIGIEILNPKFREKPESFEEELRRQRQQEDESLQEDYQAMIEVLKKESCISLNLMRTYGMSQGSTCGGCPYCRSVGDDHRLTPVLAIVTHRSSPKVEELKSSLSAQFKPYKRLVVTTQPNPSIEDLKKIFCFSVSLGIQQLIVPQVNNDFYALLSSSQRRWSVFKSLDVLNPETPDKPLPHLPTLIQFSGLTIHDLENLFRWYKYYSEPIGTYIILLIPENLQLPKVGNDLLKNLINGNMLTAPELSRGN
jgi:ATP-dependent DNA helicase RecQ